MRYNITRLTAALLSLLLLTSMLFTPALAPAVVYSEGNTPVSVDESGSKTDSSTPDQDTNQQGETEVKDEKPVDPEDVEQDKDGTDEAVENDTIDESNKEDTIHNPDQDTADEEEVITEEPKKEIYKFNPAGLMLSPGMSNEEVLRIKRFLTVKGYKNIEHNFLYDWATAEMVRDYQAKNKLVPDGIIGKNTFNAMNKDMEENEISIPPVSIRFTSTPGEKRWIIINLSSNMLYHLDGETVLGAYPVATGKEVGFTPQEKFKIVNKLVNPAWGGAGRLPPVKGGAPDNPLGKRWMGLDIAGGYTYGIHGNSDETSIGKYVSLGCIRMPNKDVENLFDNIQIGTTVLIGYQGTLSQYGITFQ